MNFSVYMYMYLSPNTVCLQGAAAVGMIGFTYASVPLYRVFCAVSHLLRHFMWHDGGLILHVNRVAVLLCLSHEHLHPYHYVYCLPLTFDLAE